MTYIFVKHRHDGKYEVGFTAENDRYYRRMRLSLRAYIPLAAREFNSKARTWVVEGECQREIERWLARTVEDLNPSVEFSCERRDAWEAAVKESYRALHVQTSAPWEVVHSAYLSLVQICRAPDGENGEQLERINRAYETLRSELKNDDLGEER